MFTISRGVHVRTRNRGEGGVGSPAPSAEGGRGQRPAPSAERGRGRETRAQAQRRAGSETRAQSRLTKQDQLALVIAHGKSVAAWARQNDVINTESSVVDQPLDHLPAQLLRDPAGLASRHPSLPKTPATLSPRTPLSLHSRSGWETARTLRPANLLATTHIAAGALGTLATGAVGELIVRRRYVLLKKAAMNTDNLLIGEFRAGLNTLVHKKAEFPVTRRSH